MNTSANAGLMGTLSTAAREAERHKLYPQSGGRSPKHSGASGISGANSTANGMGKSSEKFSEKFSEQRGKQQTSGQAPQKPAPQEPQHSSMLERVLAFARAHSTELVSVGLVLGAILMMLAMVSYSPLDYPNAKVSFSEATTEAVQAARQTPRSTVGLSALAVNAATKPYIVENWLGYAGAVAAHFLFHYTIGYAAVIFPLLMLVWAAALYKRTLTEQVLLGTALALLGGTLLASMVGVVQLSSWSPDLIARPEWSGSVGQFLARMLWQMIGTVGALLMLAAAIAMVGFAAIDLDIERTLERAHGEATRLKTLWAAYKADKRAKAAHRSTSTTAEPPPQSTVAQPSSLEASANANTDLREPEQPLEIFAEAEEADEPARMFRAKEERDMATLRKDLLEKYGTAFHEPDTKNNTGTKPAQQEPEPPQVLRQRRHVHHASNTNEENADINNLAECQAMQTQQETNAAVSDADALMGKRSTPSASPQHSAIAHSGFQASVHNAQTAVTLTAAQATITYVASKQTLGQSTMSSGMSSGMPSGMASGEERHVRSIQQGDDLSTLNAQVHAAVETLVHNVARQTASDVAASVAEMTAQAAAQATAEAVAHATAQITAFETAKVVAADTARETAQGLLREALEQGLQRPQPRATSFADAFADIALPESIAETLAQADAIAAARAEGRCVPSQPTPAQPALHNSELSTTSCTSDHETSKEPTIHIASINNGRQQDAFTESSKNLVHDHNAALDEHLDYLPPTLDLLNISDDTPEIDEAELRENARLLTDKLRTFRIEIENLTVTPGPVVTQYEFVPAAGIKVSQIEGLADDIALALKARGLRIIAPVPGRGTVAVEIPNHKPTTVRFSSIVDSDGFRDNRHRLPLALGKTISGEVFCTDLAKMPHLLIAGSTGSGKSVGINTIIASLLYKMHPRDLKLVVIDPKKIEMSQYRPLLKHFLAVCPDIDEAIITNTPNAVIALKSVEAEMERRYDVLAKVGQRNIVDYNEKVAEGRYKNTSEFVHRQMPYIVVIIDELADLMMTSGNEVEAPICRLAQLARAVGIHLVVATQRPSVDVVTGLIKANFPARIAYQVASKIDSRTILDMSGAEHLLGNGDMLFVAGGSAKPLRVQNSFLSTEEVENICEFISTQRGYSEPYMLPSVVAKSGKGVSGGDVDDRDELFDEAARLVVRHQQGSVSLLQRRLRIGYSRAARIIDQLEEVGIVGPFDGSKGRQILVESEAELESML